MLATTDLIGLGALISATLAGIAGVIVALRQPKIGKQVDEVHAAVSTPNGLTLGEMVQKNEDRHEDGTCTEHEHNDPPKG